MNYTKSITLVVSLFLSSFLAQAQNPSQSKSKGDAHFVNPIFAGDYADPTVMREGDNYYIAHSSFEYYPGLLIWQSKDLINWTPVTHALNKYVGSVWAPNLVKYKNKYYIYFPANNSNFVVTADSIIGPWSEPVDLKANFIDPGHFTDKDGNRYLYFNNGGYVPLSDDGLSITGELKPAYNGWKIPREWSIECFCLEGPTIAQRGDFYYLTVAQGGTAGPATSHMVISARSKTPFGPWENSPYNPIIRTKANSEKWWSKGHGSLVDGTDGKWWMVYHAYENGYYNMGRQTLLEPVEWTKDGWFKIPGTSKADAPTLKPKQSAVKSSLTLSDEFNSRSLKPQWQFFGEYDTTRFHLDGKSLTIKGKGNSVADSAPLTFIPSHHSYTAQVELLLEGNATGGLVLFYDSKYYSGILADKQNILANLKGWQFPTEKNVIDKHVFLKIRNIKGTVDMYYSVDGQNWLKIENSLEVSGYNHNVLGGFLSLRVGLCAVGEGTVSFKNFIYQPIN